MKNQYKSIAFMLLLAILLSFCACGKAGETSDTTYSHKNEANAADTETVEQNTADTDASHQTELITMPETDSGEDLTDVTADRVSKPVLETSETEETEADTQSETEKKSEAETENDKEDEMGLDITNRSDLVSICYSVWFDGILGEGEGKVEEFYNVPDVLAGKAEWGKEGQFHYWSKPAQGYYRSTDKDAIRNNMTLLAEADIDFIILDYTNARDFYVTNAEHGRIWAFDPLKALCETIVEMRKEGKKTPYIALWCGESDGTLIKEFYDRFYKVDEWKDCFVYWDGKPFMIYTKPTDTFPLPKLFTVRYMWGLTDEKCWRFLNVNNSKTVYINNGVLEQISVAVASQETYISIAETAHGRRGGKFFYEQWRSAFRFHPKVVTVTWWNEWAAQRFVVDGETRFVDNYTPEYSRDIEPMEGGHGDLYYRWLCEYVRAYKAGEECPVLVEKSE